MPRSHRLGTAKLAARGGRFIIRARTPSYLYPSVQTSERFVSYCFFYEFIRFELQWREPRRTRIAVVPYITRDSDSIKQTVASAAKYVVARATRRTAHSNLNENINILCIYRRSKIRLEIVLNGYKMTRVKGNARRVPTGDLADVIRLPRVSSAIEHSDRFANR